MQGTAGRFDAHDAESATQLFERVLEEPGRWCNLSFEPIDDGNIAADSGLFGFLAARGPANPLATVMSPAKDVSWLLEVGIQHQAGTKAATQLKEAELYGPTNARVVQDHPRRGLVVRWPQNEDLAALQAWIFPAMRELSRAPSTNAVLWEIRDL